MKINKADLNLFRNLKGFSFNPGDATIVFGNNRLGKTNVLNAVCWCLCGCDLEGQATDLINVPTDLRKGHDGEIVIDVGLNFETFSVRRTATINEGSVATSLEIDGVPCQNVKAGEIELDKKLGILEATIGNPKGFSLRRFLIDPRYIEKVGTPAVRQFIVKALGGDDVEHEVWENLPEYFKSKLTGGNIETLSAKNSKWAKDIKRESDNLKAVYDYFQERKPNDYDELIYINNRQATCNQNRIECDARDVAIDQWALFVSRELELRLKDSGANIRLLEKGVGDGAWKSVCYPITENGYPVWQASTSERIAIGLRLQSFIAKLLELPCLPRLIDEFETIDNETAAKLQSDQIIAAKVVPGVTELSVRTL